MMSVIATANARPERIQLQQLPGKNDDINTFIFRSAPSSNINSFRKLYGKVSKDLWNAPYWPIYRGLLAERYNDPHFPKTGTWNDFYSYYLSRPPAMIASYDMQSLSPAEKYDLLFEDSSWSLTSHMWNKGKSLMNRDGTGNLPIWFGICHGWSAANHMGTPEPLHNVILQSVHGNYSVEFTPSDIKGLVSYMWAESSPLTRRLGNRCYANQPIRDSFQRIIDPNCLDDNPMSWHLAVMNRVGRDGDSFVMDSTMNWEVWNYAVDSYYMRYFNPLTLKPTTQVADAIVPRKDFMTDPYQQHRSENSHYIIGVIMEVFFPAATEPSSPPSSIRLYKSKRFVYDLELNEKLNVIGGEWHSPEHPDFLWTYEFASHPVYPHDINLEGDLSATFKIPEEWGDLARQSSSRGKVLSQVVDFLAMQSTTEKPTDQPSEPPTVPPGTTVPPGPVEEPTQPPAVEEPPAEEGDETSPMLNPFYPTEPESAGD